MERAEEEQQDAVDAPGEGADWPAESGATEDEQSERAEK